MEHSGHSARVTRVRIVTAVRILCAAAALVAIRAPADLRAQGERSEPASPGSRGSAVPLVLRGARVHTVSGLPVDRGVVVIERGLFVAVGEEGVVAIPRGAAVEDLTGREIIPGLVDTHSHAGLHNLPSAGYGDVNESSGPTQGALRALDAILPTDPSIRLAQAGGVTTANIMPGSGNVMGGQTAFVKMRGATIEEMLIRKEGVRGGMKMANGENPLRSYGSRGEAPGTRMAVAALQRRVFLRGRDYLEKWARYREKKAGGEIVEEPAVDLELEAVGEILRRERVVHFHSHRADDLMTAMRLAEEFGFRLVLQHATEAYKVAGEIARRRVPVSIIAVDAPGGKPEMLDFTLANGGLLERAGVKVAIHTDHDIVDTRFLLRAAGLEASHGMSEEGALRAVTLAAAEMLDLGARVGSIEAEKDADLVVLDGPPFSVSTRVLATYIDGEKVFDRSRAEDLRYATGGWQAAARYPRFEPARDRMPPAAQGGAAQKRAPSKEGRGSSPGKKEAPAAGAPGSERALAVRAALLHTSGPAGTVRDGMVIVRGGKVVEAGPASTVKVPSGAERLEIDGAVVTPGLIDTHCALGLSGALNVAGDRDQDETSGPRQADLRAVDAFNPAEPLLRYALEQGLTAFLSGPGEANPIGGQAAVFKTAGGSLQEMVVRSPAAMVFALGEEPKTTYGRQNKAPTTRMSTAALIRKALEQARQYRDRRRAYEAKPEKERKDPPEIDPELEALGAVLDRKMPALFAAHRRDDLGTALRIGLEFGLDLILSRATEAYLMADELARAGVGVSAGPTMQRLDRLEVINASLENAAVLAARGVPLALQTGYEDYVPKSRVLRWEAGMAMANGLGFERTLKAVTIDAARLLRVAERLGSLEPGKDADLVVFSGDPFEYATAVEAVLIDGRLVYRRER
jgi:imidazolonepropionase-like amidohydrolase